MFFNLMYFFLINKYDDPTKPDIDGIAMIRTMSLQREWASCKARVYVHINNPHICFVFQPPTITVVFCLTTEFRRITV